MSLLGIFLGLFILFLFLFGKTPFDETVVLFLFFIYIETIVGNIYIKEE